MGFFSKLFNRKKKTTVEEASSDMDISKISVKKIGLVFSDGSTNTNLDYEDPVGFNFTTISRAYATDSYIRQAIDKHVDFAFKQGWDLVGSDAEAVQYINDRFYALELAMGMPMDVFLKEAFKNFTLYENCFILKNFANAGYKYPGNLKVSPGMYNKTINSYQCLPIDSISIARDVYGNVLKYKQEVEGSSVTKIEFNPNQIIHIYSNKPSGRGFGFPSIWEVLEDVKILRQLEELMIKSVYKNVFPLHVYTVGLNADGQRCKAGEIEEVSEKMGSLQLDGGIVVPERHKIEILGAQGKMLDLKDYLSYCENRVFTGLNVSPTIMGRSDTSNKSTASNLDQMFKDSVKSKQTMFAFFITKEIINELLAEGGFNFIQDSSKRVSFRFREVDVDLKIAEENHAIQLYMQNGITFPEFRRRIGSDPIDSYDELYFNIIKNNVDEETAKQKETAAKNSGSNKDQPTNQYGKKNNPKTKEAILHEFIQLISSTMKRSNNDLTMYKAVCSQFVNNYKESFKDSNINVIESLLNKYEENLNDFNIEQIKSIISLLN